MLAGRLTGEAEKAAASAASATSAASAARRAYHSTASRESRESRPSARGTTPRKSRLEPRAASADSHSRRYSAIAARRIAAAASSKATRDSAQPTYTVHLRSLGRALSTAATAGSSVAPSSVGTGRSSGRPRSATPDGRGWRPRQGGQVRAGSPCPRRLSDGSWSVQPSDAARASRKEKALFPWLEGYPWTQANISSRFERGPILREKSVHADVQRFRNDRHGVVEHLHRRTSAAGSLRAGQLAGHGGAKVAQLAVPCD